MSLKIKLHRLNLNLICCYGYTADKKYSLEERETFYSKAEDHFIREKDCTNIALGDFNSRIIKRNVNEATGKWIFPCKESNIFDLSPSNRECHDTFMKFAVGNSMRIVNTFFQKNDIKLATFVPKAQGQVWG